MAVLSYFNYSYPVFAFAVFAETVAFRVGVMAQKLVYGASQRARALAVYNAYGLKVSHCRFVKIFINRYDSFVNQLAAKVDFAFYRRYGAAAADVVGDGLFLFGRFRLSKGGNVCCNL